MKLSGNVHWENGKLDFDISGLGPFVGNLDIQQSIEWTYSGNILEMKVKGKADMEEGWLTENGLSPMKNDIQLDWDSKNRILNGHITKHFDGEKYEIVVEENNVKMDF